ncbi:uncharacterized protein LOC130809160 [Amaranthus tricolor]|uniref:uncharacterized protein LOC130809160 n=1 Tax=Amaranthus tricolor TaxID=29722 RepID=UPI0025841BBD|nr:uncharacterized protein LOC130809160 [Amaranthus tricolor]
MPIRFTVVDLNFPYNAIMGLPLINKIKAAIFPHQLLLQFETDNGQVGILKGDQVTARQCLVNTLKRGSSETPAKRKREDNVPAVMSVYEENLSTHERPRPIERYEEVDMFEGRQIKVGKDLPNDMITKSKQASQHAADLRETFLTLRKHQMKLNPDKCVFGVTGGKCLGFLVDERGIEANPDKIRAIQSMRSPTSVKEVQKLTGCVAALGRFLSKSADKSEAEESFRQLKEHLSTLPKLVSPIKEEKLVLYVSVSEYSLSGVLVAEREKKQLPIYYISHAFRGSEGNYGEVEKVIFAIVMLADFGIEYEPRTAIKAQALADFIAESTLPYHPEPNQEWKLYVDGSSTQSASGAGLLIVSSAGVRMERAVRFEFATSNNEAEYEALLMGLRICYETGAKKLSAFSDSQLIVGQVNGEFEAKDDSMKMYLQQVKEFVQKFDKFTLEHIPRSQNAQADSLAKLASSAETSAARDIIWEVLPNPSINFMVDTIDRSETWMEPYIEYLRNQTLPQDKCQAKMLRKKARWKLYPPRDTRRWMRYTPRSTDCHWESP